VFLELYCERSLRDKVRVAAGTFPTIRSREQYQVFERFQESYPADGTGDRRGQ